MILEKQTDTLVLEEGEVQGSTNMEIDADSHQFLMRMLSKFYSDGIGSLIRETASNALDSHRESGVKDPIIVSFTQNKDGNYEFSVEDFGMGMDDKDVENVIKKYGKSTKRLSVNQLGAFGLGFKSPLAYSSSFYFIGRKNGKERKWMMYESEDETNKIDLLYEGDTTERNGVKIIVPVKYGDRSAFYSKIKEQLAYFESVYFNCPNYVNNDFKITRYEDFQHSELCHDNNLHICLDNVYYPIDFAKLGIDRIYLPIGLRFGLSDGLFPLPNRETLKYTPEAKQVILEKIKKVANFLVNRYNENIKDTESVHEIIKFFQYSSRNVKTVIPGKELDVNQINKYSDVKYLSPKLKGITYLTERRIYEIKDYLLQEYSVKYTLNNGRFYNEENSRWGRQLQWSDLQNTYIFTEMHGLKKAYLRDIISGYHNKKFVKKDNLLKLGNVKNKNTGAYNNYITILQLHNFPRTEWRARIKELQYVINLLTKDFVNADAITIPQEWLDGRKKERVQAMAIKGTNVRRKKLTGEVVGKASERLDRYVSGKHCKFVSTTFQMKEAHKQKYFVVYGNSECEEKFQKYYTIFGKKPKVKFVIFSERELKNLKEVELHNWMSMEEFEKGKHKIFKRAVTAYLIDKLTDDYSNVFNKLNVLKEVSSYLADNMVKLEKYRSEYFLDGDVDLYKSLLEVAKEHNLFDTTIYDVYKEVKFTLDKLYFVNPIFRNIGYSTEKDMTQCIRDLFKYHKQKIDWQHYKLPIIEEVVPELTEETIEELVN